MVKDVIKLDELNMEELAGVISIYPWFSRARVEMCRRMAALGEGAWSEDRYAEEALFVSSRKDIYNLLRASRRTSYADADVEALLQAPKGAETPLKKDIIVLGGDFFSKEDYQKARIESDDAIGSIAYVQPSEATRSAAEYLAFGSNASGFYSETLAEVYLAQGVTDKAKEIYSELMLRYPEKNAYFAAQIEKIENNI